MGAERLAYLMAMYARFWKQMPAAAGDFHGGDLAAIVLELKNPVYKEFLSLYSRTRAFEGLGDLFFALSDRTIKAGCDIYALILFKGAKKSEAIFGGKFTPADFGDCILVGKYVSKINPKDKDT